MAWFKVDDKFHSSRKVLSIPRRHRLAAAGLWTIAGSWCGDQLTDGVVPKYMLDVWGATPAVVNALVKARLWEDKGDELTFTNWLQYQPSKKRVEDERVTSKERMRNIRAKQKQAEPQDSNPQEELFGRTTPNRSENVPDPVPFRPDPTTVPKGTVNKRPDTVLPHGWTPNADHHARAAETDLDIGREEAKFRAHAEEKGRKAKNWNAAFSRWLMQASEYAENDKARGAKSSDRQGDLLKSEMARLRAKNQTPTTLEIGAV